MAAGLPAGIGMGIGWVGMGIVGIGGIGIEAGAGIGVGGTITGGISALARASSSMRPYLFFSKPPSRPIFMSSGG